MSDTILIIIYVSILWSILMIMERITTAHVKYLQYYLSFWKCINIMKTTLEHTHYTTSKCVNWSMSCMTWWLLYGLWFSCEWVVDLMNEPCGMMLEIGNRWCAYEKKACVPATVPFARWAKTAMVVENAIGPIQMLDFAYASNMKTTRSCTNMSYFV